jgi:hypothetical protein
VIVILEFAGSRVVVFRADESIRHAGIGTQWLYKGVPVFAIPARGVTGLRRVTEFEELPPEHLGRRARKKKKGVGDESREPGFNASRASRDLRRKKPNGK